MIGPALRTAIAAPPPLLLCGRTTGTLELVRSVIVVGSLPAYFAITSRALIQWTAHCFAVARPLYFMLAGTDGEAFRLPPQWPTHCPRFPLTRAETRDRRLPGAEGISEEGEHTLVGRS
jgi:hypothetical protein